MSEGAQISNLYPARPTVELSNEAQPELSDRIRSLRISEEEDGLYACELTLTNWGNTDRRVDFLYFDRDLIDFTCACAPSRITGPRIARAPNGPCATCFTSRPWRR